jgi:hypothetical protein
MVTPELTDPEAQGTESSPAALQCKRDHKRHAGYLRGGQAEAGLMGGRPSRPIALDGGVQCMGQLMLQCAP